MEGCPGAFRCVAIRSSPGGELRIWINRKQRGTPDGRMSRRISMRSNTELSWRRAPYCLRLS
nr:MAG TPA: hypothetical protein [Caudoviricetes sp.]